MSNKKREQKEESVEQSDHYRFRSKRVAVDYTPSAFSHIFQMESSKIVINT